MNTLDHGLSNARSEATNTHLRALTKRAYGFHSPEALIGMAMLTRGGLCPHYLVEQHENPPTETSGDPVSASICDGRRQENRAHLPQVTPRLPYGQFWPIM
ncbi:transposase family protein [Mycobacterium xenopi 3993]|nr:transposase family protein [Mycobacterium xenopi 3993]